MNPTPLPGIAATRLSVCIPTHHGRCAVLREALESIAVQAPQIVGLELEIVVSDNASADGTEAMVREFGDQHPDLRVVYGRNERDIRLGNIFKVVERASGEWCWLFGSDDHMAPDGLRLISEAISWHPDASGIAFRRANFSYDMQTQLEADRPEFCPAGTETTVYRGFERVLREVGFVYAYLGSNVVRRDRWLAAAEREADDAVRLHENWPQLIVLSDMARHDPTWVWIPCSLVKARAGRPYLVEEAPDRMDLAMTHCVLVDGLRRAWGDVTPPASSLHTALMRKSYGVFGSAEAVRYLKTMPRHSLRRDLGMLLIFTRAFWRLGVFRRRCLPELLVPAFAGRLTRRLKRPGPPMAPLAPEAMATTVQLVLPTGLRPREMVHVTCLVTNRGRAEMRPTLPHPVALGFRWVERSTGDIVRDDGRAALPGPLAPGELVTVVARLMLPWEPGAYELRVAPVQELVAWFDDVDTANGVTFDVQLDLPSVSCAS